MGKETECQAQEGTIPGPQYPQLACLEIVPHNPRSPVTAIGRGSLVQGLLVEKVALNKHDSLEWCSVVTEVRTGTFLYHILTCVGAEAAWQAIGGHLRLIPHKHGKVRGATHPIPCPLPQRTTGSREDAAFITKPRNTNVPVQEEGTVTRPQTGQGTDKAMGAPNPTHLLVTVWPPPRSMYIGGKPGGQGSAGACP